MSPAMKTAFSSIHTTNFSPVGWPWACDSMSCEPSAGRILWS